MKFRFASKILAVSFVSLTALPVCAFPADAAADLSDVGYVETFALATDRQAALAELVPGTDSYYYYHALNALNEKKLSEFETLLKRWENDRNGVVSDDMRGLENRYFVLLYDTDPAKSITQIKRIVEPDVNLSRKTGEMDDMTPTSFDNSLVSTVNLLNKKMEQNQDSLSFIRDAGLCLVATHKNLNARQRRELLTRLPIPVCSGLVDLIVEDLKEKDSRGFGSIPIHKQLTRFQLEELAKKYPTVSDQKEFVDAFISKLAPIDEINLSTDIAQNQAYLERLWKYVSSLSSAHNSLKAAVLYNRLAFDETQGVYDRERFMQYIKLPRSVPYLQPVYRDAWRQKGGFADLGVSFPTAFIQPVPRDEPLVKRFLLELLKAAPNTSEFSPYLSDEFLKPIFAESKIINGVGAPLDWVSLISPEEYRAIKERVNIDLALQNPSVFAPEDPVSLSVFLKNVPSLVVKTYEINTLNYYRLNHEPMNLAINLDGLVASEISTFNYNDPSERTIKRTFPLKSLNKRGVYVVEFIGNGKSSRALIQKGGLDVVEETTPAGQAFTVFNEKGQQLMKASAWLGGREFKASDKGNIFIPFSSSPGPATLVVESQGFATLVSFTHAAEKYTLKAGIYVDRESLLRHAKADVVVRPSLLINNVPTSLSLLEKAKITVSMTDAQGIPSEKEFADIRLREDKDTILQISVPENLVKVSIKLSGEVKNITTGKTDAVEVVQDFTLNGILKKKRTRCVFTGRDEAGYFAEVRGLNGEPIPDFCVTISFYHRLFKDVGSYPLKTDAKGRITLGALSDVGSLNMRIEEKQNLWLSLPQDECSIPESLHAQAGQPIHIPFTWLVLEGGKPLDRVSLLEKRGGSFFKDWSAEVLSITNGFLEIAGLPSGDFSLNIGYETRPIHVTQAIDGSSMKFAISENRMLELPKLAPLNITSLSQTEKSLEITIANPTPFTRVHIYASRYLPELEYDVFSILSLPNIRELASQIRTPTLALYQSGRDIGDEYRYIMERQSAAKFLGNMLERPGLLLTSWAVRDTTTGAENLQEGDGIVRSPIVMRGIVGSRSPGQRGKALSAYGGSAVGEHLNFSSLDFLAQPSGVLLNLAPDANGRISIPLDALHGLPIIRVVALDPVATVVRNVTIKSEPIKTRELRLTNALDPKKQFAIGKIVVPVPEGSSAEVPDFTTARFMLFDSVAKAFRIFSTLNPSLNLQEFSFITQWSSLDQQEQNRLYSKYACHELNFFLYHKDRKFFDTTIAPNLVNKRNKTFMDDWLLGNDLAPYAEQQCYSRLNPAERALLAKRLPAERAAGVVREIRESVELIKPSPEVFNRRFDTALRLGSMETDQSAAQVEMNQAVDALAGRARKATLDAPMSALAMPSAAPAAAGEPTPPPPPEPQALRQEEQAKPMADKKLQSEKDASDAQSADGYFAGDAVNKRAATRIFFRQAEVTQEWAENNYWQTLPENQNAVLFPQNRFWLEYAEHDSAKPFLPPSFLEADSSFIEIMLALAVVDLPFSAGQHTEVVKDISYRLTAASNAILFYREIRPVDAAKPDAAQVIVVQRFFRDDDRYRMVDGEQVEKTVTGEFLSGVVYGAQVVLANSTPQRQKINTIMQIPVGSIPVNATSETRDEYLVLEPYTTTTRESFFYFPQTGDFAQFPATASDPQASAIASAAPFEFHVVSKLTDIDKTSWVWISQNGTEDDVIHFLETSNIQSFQDQLAEIGWRMKDSKFFVRVLSLLRSRQVYNHALWAYAFVHQDTKALGEFLLHDNFSKTIGPYLSSTLLDIDPITEMLYQHLEYAPLINPRVHKLGPKNTILNNAFRVQYQNLLKVIAFKPVPTQEDSLAVTYYLMLQDRIPEALSWFTKVDRTQVAEKMQYDYMQAYLSLYRGDIKTAAEIAKRHENETVEKWRTRFGQIDALLKEIKDPLGLVNPKGVDPENRNATLDALTSTEPSLELSVEARKIRITAQNTKNIMLNFYPMDIELLFSHNPFMREASDRFSIISPAFTMSVLAPVAGASSILDIPKQFQMQNVMVEAVADGIRRSCASYANTIDVRIIENYGQLIVTHATTGVPIPSAYVKVYSKEQDSGEIRFFKDGYTDLRGRFDYFTLNPGLQLQQPKSLAILVLSPEYGAVVKEANPPKQ